MSENDISGQQCRAARAGKLLTQDDLSGRSGVSRGTIASLEANRDIIRANKSAIILAFLELGVTFEQDVDSERVIFHRERLPALTDGS